MHRVAERWLEALEPYAEGYEQGCFAARETQIGLLKSLLEKNSDSAFGREHRFSGIRSYSDYQKQVPLMYYEDYRVWIDRLASGEQGVLTVEHVIGFEQTSGTTSGRKIIPYTETFREQIAVAVSGWMQHWKKQYPRAFAGRSYWALSPTSMAPIVLPSGVWVGLDGDGGYFPSEVSAPLAEFLIIPEIAGDYMGNTARALLAAKDLSSVSVWSPTFLLELDRLVRILVPYFETWSEYWTSLEIVSCWTDAQAAKWIPQLQALLGDVTIEQKGLLLTEGICSIPGRGGAELAVNSHFYEFIGVDGIVLCDALKEGEVYEIVMTTGAGLYRYRTGDRVKVTAMSDTGVPSFSFIGRGGSSDLVGEKLSEEFVEESFKLAQMSGVLIANVDHYILLSADLEQRELFSNALLRNPYYQQAVHLKQLKPLCFEPLSEKKMFRWLESCASSTGAHVGDVKLPSLVAMDSPFYNIIMEQVSMGETVRLVFERSPDYFVGAGVQAEEVEVYAFATGSSIEGLFSVGKRKVYFNGEVKSLRYLCDLRLIEQSRGGTYLARAYKFTKQLVEEGEIMQSLILEDNKKTMDILTSKRSFLPNYTENTRYVTHLLRAKKRKNTSLRTRNANAEDIPRLQKFYDKQAAQYQFAPVIYFSEIETSTHFYGLNISDFRLLEKEDEILAMTAVWDQNTFKRTKVVFYARWLRYLRPLLNPFLGIPLPIEGKSIVAYYLFAFYVDNNDQKHAKTLLDDVIQELPNKSLLLAGLDEKDPLQNLLNTYRGRRRYGKHYVVTYDDVLHVKGITKFEISRI